MEFGIWIWLDMWKQWCHPRDQINIKSKISGPCLCSFAMFLIFRHQRSQMPQLLLSAKALTMPRVRARSPFLRLPYFLHIASQLPLYRSNFIYEVQLKCIVTLIIVIALHYRSRWLFSMLICAALSAATESRKCSPKWTVG